MSGSDLIIDQSDKPIKGARASLYVRLAPRTGEAGKEDYGLFRSPLRGCVGRQRTVIRRERAPVESSA